ncbi:hypothetical protein DPMN_167791 [Dreissena polymorpha]|uniref:Uncharacterized protein n=1 Tax=Dreissena polymorpha TaxID=45954 RepID=A0A9D4IVC0_DREPO|nr:hypothetical protein DPMN_167791 [Dreissena polymorpha]
MDITGKMFHSHMRGGNIATVDARHQRDRLRDYFVSPVAVGVVDWQQIMAGVVLSAAVEERNRSESN